MNVDKFSHSNRQPYLLYWCTEIKGNDNQEIIFLNLS